MRKACAYAMILAAVLLLGANDISASRGNAVGSIYSTDILAKVNGAPVESYNIGGKTVIIAEDLRENSDVRLDVVYNDGEKLWTIHSMLRERNEASSRHGESIVRRGSGDVPRSIFSTDVKVLFNGKPTTAYDIDGRTAFCIEDLGDLNGSPNDEYGYSEYLARSVWNERDRVIELMTFNPNSSEIMGYNVHSYEYTCVDNVLYAKHNPMNAYYSDFSQKTGSVYNYTDRFKKDYFVLKPFYLNINGENSEVGCCVVSNCRRSDETVFRLSDAKRVKILLDNAKPPAKKHDAAIEYLCGNYEVKSRAENDSYTVLLLREASTGCLYVVAVRKTGGYLRLFSYPSSHSNVSFSLEKNTVTVEVCPFGGPHGPTTMRTVLNLDEHEF